MQKSNLRGHVCLIGAPSDLRALLGYGEIAQRSQEGNPAPEVVKRTPSVLEMLVAGGKGECGRDTAAVGKAFSVNKTGEAAGEQNERTLTPLHRRWGRQEPEVQGQERGRASNCR